MGILCAECQKVLTSPDEMAQLKSIYTDLVFCYPCALTITEGFLAKYQEANERAHKQLDDYHLFFAGIQEGDSIGKTVDGEYVYILKEDSSVVVAPTVFSLTHKVRKYKA